MRPCSLSIAALSLLALPAAAAIQSATPGTLVHAAAPTVGTNGYGGQYAHAWNERQSFVLTNQPVDLLGNGHSNSPTPGLVSGLVDSHMLHAESGWPINPSVHSGTVTFNAPIVGVIWTAAGLNASDPLCAPAGTSYSTSLSRGLVPGVEVVVVSGNAITFQFIRGRVFPYEYTQVRVLTAVPGPGAGVALGAAGLVGARRRRM